jgi:hypothetical protein
MVAMAMAVLPEWRAEWRMSEGFSIEFIDALHARGPGAVLAAGTDD